MPARKFQHLVRVQLVKERAGTFGPRVQCAEDVDRHLRTELASLDREHFVVVHLDVKGRILSRETVSVGHLTSALVHPREVFKGAILANAASIVLAHNHPSGDAEPSSEDAQLTRRLVEAGDVLGIPVVDHVVIAESGFVSLFERGFGR
jgi:DNA repair protein RadC